MAYPNYKRAKEAGELIYKQGAIDVIGNILEKIDNIGMASLTTLDVLQILKETQEVLATPAEE